MKKTLSFIMTLCMMTSLLSTLAFPANSETVSNYYVYDGQYTSWTGDPAVFNPADTDLVWTSLAADSTLSNDGVAANCNLYILDDSDIYFGDFNLGTGGLYTPAGYESSFGINIADGTLQAAEIDVADELEIYIGGAPNVNISGSVSTSGDFDVNSGTLRAAEVNAGGDFWIGDQSSVFVSGDVTVGYELHSSGCVLDVGGNIESSKINFKSYSAELFVTVGGDIITGAYLQAGGSVSVAGNVTVASTDSDCTLTLTDNWAYYNFTELNVGGDITVTGDIVNHDYMGRISIGNFVYAEGSANGRTDYPYNNNIPIVVNVGGRIEASNEIAIYEGTVTAGGAIATTETWNPKTIYIYGGNITAASIESSTDIYIGESYDEYDLNDRILINLTGDMTAAYNVTIYGGDINVGDTIATTAAEGNTINIYGGCIDVGAIDSATDVYIGDGENNYGTNSGIFVNATSLTAAYNFHIYAGTVHAQTVSCSGSFLIYDDATLFDAVLADNTPPPQCGEYELDMNRVTLSGFIHNALSRVTITSGENYEKSFTGAADSEGRLVVWLEGASTLSGSAMYRQSGGPTLTATATATDEGEYVSALNFGNVDYTLSNIPISVPDAVFNYDGGYNPWSSDNPFEAYTDTEDYTLTFFRNGEIYTFEGGFVAGDYEVAVTSVPQVGTYGVTEENLPSFEAGYDKFTIEPLVITVAANKKTASVGGTLPTFTVSISDNNDNGDDFITSYLRDEYSELFYAQSYGTTASAGSYPIYARADCKAYWTTVPEAAPYMDEDNNYNSVYASSFIWLNYSVQFRLVNGTLTVGSGGRQISSYSVTATAKEGGSISPADTSLVNSGNSVTYAIKADSGYVISDVLVDGVSVGAVASYVFSNVTKNHTIVASFAIDDSDCPSKKFSDLDTSLWYHEGIDYVLRASLFKGATSTTFEPDEAITRGMLVSVLYRLEKSPAITTGEPFDDVPSGAWFADAVSWAYANKIVMGYDSDSFVPNAAISREEMALLMYRYAQYKGYSVTATDTLAAYVDAGNVSGWALGAVKWAVAEELIIGTTTTKLEPQATSTRAQAAVILMRFVENIVKAAK